MFCRRNYPPLTFSILRKFFLIGLIGNCFGEILGYLGIRYSSPTLGSAMGNLIPAFTFLLAIVFRMEILDLKRSSSQAKALGTIVSISGAFIVTLYKGLPIIIIPSDSDVVPDQLLLSSQSNWIIGGLLLAVTSFLVALWNIVQTAAMKEYPSEIAVVFYSSLIGTIQCAIVALMAERNPTAWELKPGMELAAIVYAAIFGKVYRNLVHTWTLHRKGPVFVSMFRPLGIIIAVAMGVTFLGDTLHIGSVIGAIVIALGFYGVMWGKAKEEKMIETNEVIYSANSSTQRMPLLSNNNVMDMNP
ncbi:Wat1-related protein [Thalictrum thalictroides]|uniref:WAT1-related protein n=1 Tax=Thalictrum thalictroides TaxID=46969 RepID=A0A7J6X3C6_THATH|nr:Wat1-related protein [Thalictrum thalictroides]